MPLLRITKSNGELVPFRADKIRETLVRSGAKPHTVEHVVRKVTGRMKDRMSTRRVHAIVMKELAREDRCMAHRYNLRNGLIRLGPEGFVFEEYIAAVLAAYGYDAQVPPKDVSGLCVKHEIDVIAQQEDKTVMIEAKFRNDFEDTVTLKDALSTWARYQDLREGAKRGLCQAFNDCWIVTNGRFSDRAQQFGECKGMRMVGWGTGEHSLPKLVDYQALYPLTVLDDLQKWEFDAFAKRHLVLCRQVATKDAVAVAKITGITRERAEAIVRDCQALTATG